MAKITKTTEQLNWLKSRQAGAIGLISMVLVQAFHASLVLTKTSFFFDGSWYGIALAVFEGIALSAAISFSIVFYTLRNNKRTALAFTILEVAINLGFYAYKIWSTRSPDFTEPNIVITIIIGIIISFVIPFSTYNFANELKV